MDGGDFYLSGVDGEDFDHIWGGRKGLLLYLGWMERTLIKYLGWTEGTFIISGMDGAH